jgi:hypothetical protein
LPTLSPDAIASGRAILLMPSVVAPKKPFITNPAIIHFISLMPLPAAYGAKLLTSRAAVKLNTPANTMYSR